MNQLRTSSIRDPKTSIFWIREENGKTPLKRGLLEDNLMQRVERSGKHSSPASGL